MKVNLGNYTWEEVKDLSDKDPVVLLPLGAFEQHGKHLPLKVDEFMAVSYTHLTLPTMELV